jgi:flagellar assembly protein FliH
MIIKKKFAQSLDTPISPASQVRGEQTSRSTPVDIYSEEISPEDIESGLAPDRRRGDRRDRRLGYRRMEDQEIISRAHEEANAIREVAAQEGFQAGLNQAQAVIVDLQDAIQSFLQAREEALSSAADDLAAMAVEIAERIIKTEVACDENLVMSIVRNTVSKVGREQKSITIKVNPVDLKLVKETMRTDSQLSEAVEVLVFEDAEVDPGSCVIETRAGQIDARFSTQLGILKQLLLTGGKA